MAAVTSPDTLLPLAVPFAVSVTVPVASTPGIVTEAAELVSVFPCVPRHGIGCGNSSPAMTLPPTWALAPYPTPPSRPRTGPPRLLVA